MDEFEKFRKSDGSIDWGAYYSQKKFFENLEAPKKSAIELEDLRIFKLADELSDYVWEIVHKWNFFEKKTLGEQWVRAADSVGANIAEGYGRFFFGEYAVFLYYARGSLKEAAYWTEKARKRKLLNNEEYGYLKERTDRLPKELNAAIKNIKFQRKKILNKW